MGAPVFLADNYKSAFKALLPRGRVWRAEDGSIQDSLLAGLSPTYERNNERAAYLLVDAFPATADELLPEWEAALGLPDPCAGPAATIQERRMQVVARFTNSGGQSAPYFIQFAANLGFAITITNYAPFRAGQSRVGSPLAGPDWSQTWAVNSSLNTVVFFRTGVSSAGDPLAIWGNAVLECELNTIKPAHTILQFHYS